MKQRPVRKLLALVLSLLLVLAFTPAAFAAEDDVAQIIGKEGAYASLSDAINAAASGDTIQLIAPVTVESSLSITGKQLNFDLNNQTITLTNGSRILVEQNADVSFDNGIISTPNYAFQVSGDCSSAHTSPSSAKLVLGSNLIVNADDCCVYVRGEGAVLEIKGKLTSKNGYATVSGNGTRNDKENNGGTEIIVQEGAVIQHMDSVEGCPLYLPQAGTVTINGGMIQGGGMAIGMKSGTLNINGGNITATGPYVPTVAPNNNGINNSGSAIMIDSNTAYAGEVNINIKGGTITSGQGDAIREVGAGTNLVSITVSEDAVLSAPEGKLDISITNDKPEEEGSKVSVTGGTFSKKIEDKYLVDDAISIKSGDNYYVGDAANKEIASATAGETIEVFKGTTITGVPEGVKVTNNTGKEITVNNEKVAAGDNITIESKPEPQPEPSNPSSSFTEPEYYPDYDEDVDYLPPVEDEEEEEKAPLYMVTCRTLNVRMGPGTSYAKLGTLSRGTFISGEYKNGWVKFTYNGQTAYSSADYLMKVDGDLSGLHVTCRTLNVRAGAGTNFDILGTLSRGTEISVRDVLPGWYEIDFLGGIGYVSSAYIG